jgi:MFS family permease
MTRRRKLAFLGLLYAAQGMPFGFQAMALPLYLREAGVSLTAIGFANLLAMPWMLKALWAPIVERVGRRRPVIIAMQLALLGLCAAAATTPPDADLAALAGIILAMNAVTATQDIAVDGLAVDLLAADELGPGNAAQVGGYKIGMLLSGGLVVALSGSLGWGWGFAIMAGVASAALVMVWSWREPAPPPRTAEVRGSGRAILAALGRVVRLPGQLWVLAIVATYKMGESMSDAMWKQYVLQDHDKRAIGLWMNTAGMAPSILGSLAGGLLAARIAPARAIAVAAVLRGTAVVGFAAIALTATTDWRTLVAASWFEDFCGGALTTSMFAFMMSQVDRRIGATHYTVLASLEVAGKTPGGVLSGIVADAAGFAVCFIAAAGLSVAYLPLLLAWAWARRRAAGATAVGSAWTSAGS